MKNNITKFAALIKREFIEHKTAYFWLPVILISLIFVMATLTLLGVGNALQVGELEIHGISNLGEALTEAEERAAQKGMELGGFVALAYWLMSILGFAALGFVVFFSLLGSLYEERRDRSVLFFKSMPVSDTQEVLAKLVAAVFIAPLILLVLSIAAQLLVALVLSPFVLAQGGPVSALWPLGYMFTGWLSYVFYYSLYALWMMPFFAWILLVSSFAPRMPFVFVVLPPLVVGIVEEVFFGSERFIEMLGSRAEGFALSFEQDLTFREIVSPADLHAGLSLDVFFSGLGNSLVSGNFWMGLAVAGVMLYGAIELRKRSLAL